MTRDSRDIAQISASWDTYWQGNASVAAYSAGGIHHPRLQSFWDDFLMHDYVSGRATRCLDIATGNGAIVDRMMSTFAAADCAITCLDVSPGAITAIEQRFPGVTGIVADAANIPLESGSFDIVTSQFGVEYAGAGAIREAGRVLGPGGRLGLLMHHSGGSIYDECATSLEAIRRTQDSRFIPLSMRLFETGFAACRGGDRAPYDAAGTALSPAVAVLEDILRVYGENVAGNTVARLYDDVGNIHSAIQRYEPKEVAEWLQKMDNELQAFAGRMASMCESAMDEKAFEEAKKIVTDEGLVLRLANPVIDSPLEKPLAWSIIAERP